MKILVVGASGFLGGATVRKFIRDAHEVWGTYMHRSNRVPLGCRPVSFTAIDTLDVDVDVVVIAAGNHALPSQELIGVNLNIPQQIMRQFPKAKLTFISSVSVYGSHTDMMRETSAFDNPSLYGWAKLAGEAIVRTHPKFAILRLTYLYGKDMPTNSFLPTILREAKSEKQITLYGKGERLQDYLHVDDAANLCVRASRHVANGTYLGATGSSFSNVQVAQLICKHIPGCTVSFTGIDTAPWFQFDPSETKKELSWDPLHQFEPTLQELI